MQARVNVPDDRFRWLCSLYKPKSEVPAFLEIVDIAGLVRRANTIRWVCVTLQQLFMCPPHQEPVCSLSAAGSSPVGQSLFFGCLLLPRNGGVCANAPCQAAAARHLHLS